MKVIRIQANKFSSAIEIFIAFVVTPYENYGIFCHFGGYDKGFYGMWIVLVFLSFTGIYPYSILYFNSLYHQKQAENEILCTKE